MLLRAITFSNASGSNVSNMAFDASRGLDACGCGDGEWRGVDQGDSVVVVALSVGEPQSSNRGSVGSASGFGDMARLRLESGCTSDKDAETARRSVLPTQT